MYGTLISTVTVGSGGAASIDLTSIPQTPYTDLILVTSLRNGTGNESSGGSSFALKFNGSTTGFTERNLVVLGTTATSDTNAYWFIANASDTTANYFGGATMVIPNYAGSTNKSISFDGFLEKPASTNDLRLVAGLWSNTSAITSISIYPQYSGNIAQYSSVSLYGLTKGSGGATVS